MTDFDLPAKQTVRPVVVIDTREQAPLPIRRLQAVRAGLTTGSLGRVREQDKGGLPECAALKEIGR